jgi:hypothetical protein
MQARRPAGPIDCVLDLLPPMAGGDLGAGGGTGGAPLRAGDVDGRDPR